MYKHWWYTTDRGFGIRCDKCDKEANMLSDKNFNEIEHTNDCPISDEEIVKQLDKSKQKY